MASQPRKIAFIVASTDFGSMILNRFDVRMVNQTAGIGVGHTLLETSTFEPQVGTVAMQLLTQRRQHFGDGVVVVDCGANIGVHTVAWAKGMAGWGQVLAIEAQERIFYALAGNITINNCFNARAFHAAVGAADGVLRVPTPDYMTPSSFGSLEMRQSATNEFIGQAIDYSEERLAPIRMMTIDSMQLARLDMIKIDVEGMEVEVLEGAKATLTKYLPIIIVEGIKSDQQAIIRALVSYGYEWFPFELNYLAVHPGDPTRQIIKTKPAA
jgi:FkbM family methyltransferase